ncbi:MAG: TonB-dependent receptor [Sphingomonas sp. 28-66-16]|nr:MAG: TonB-dependent receptor [Sphingomonas sp. 28-66-16]
MFPSSFPSIRRTAAGVVLAALLPGVAPAETPADSADSGDRDILVVAQRQGESIDNAPATRATVTAETIAETINAVTVEDTIKYLPSLLVRKRNIGDQQAPLATRTSGLGSSARSLIYADGALLSTLIGNNNGTASPRWSLVSPEEIARIDILYGPFSAAYAGNSIGAVVNITTRLPDKLEGTLTALANVQTFDQYNDRRILPAYQLAGTLGDRFGPLALFASVTHTQSDAQPISYVTALVPAAGSAAGAPTTGGNADLNRSGLPIRVLGASGIPSQLQDIFKLKAALDVSPQVRLTYVGGLFRNATDATAQTYLTGTASGLPVYSGSLNIDGKAYNVAAGAFSNGVYRYDQQHWSHALSATGNGDRLDWQIIGTLFDYARDEQRTPSVALPAGFAGGAGTITRLDGTGWATADAKLAWRADAAGRHVLSGGGHWDRYTLDSNRYATTDWRTGATGALNLVSRGKTQTIALWAQDAWTIAPPLTLTIGGRYEWWRAYDGVNFALAPALSVVQPGRRASGFSPKASLAYTPAPGWTARLSFGRALRFPTVGELYQAVTTGTVFTVPNPDLRPEVALSEELAIERRTAKGSVRVSLFNESIEDALISQSAPLLPGSATLYTYVQNVDRTRARGIEMALEQRDFLVRRIDLSASVTYTDATTRQDTAFPAAVGKLLPSVPRWKVTAVATWRPDDAASLTAAVRYASRNYGTLDNSDSVGNTYQGFDRYVLVDLRAAFKLTDHYQFALGIDNVNDDHYFLFHPFPQRSFTASLTYRL